MSGPLDSLIDSFGVFLKIEISCFGLGLFGVGRFKFLVSLDPFLQDFQTFLCFFSISFETRSR